MNVYQRPAAPGDAHIVNEPLINADLMQYPHAHSLDMYTRTYMHLSRGDFN